MKMKCASAECKNEATFKVLCDGAPCDICDACLIVHVSHAKHIKVLNVYIQRDWLKVNPEVKIIPKNQR
jgi:hypothetical protein